jgi:hypothetical protein
MQCAPVVARVFALRQAFAGFASGEILKSCTEMSVMRAALRRIVRHQPRQQQIVRMFSCAGSWTMGREG